MGTAKTISNVTKLATMVQLFFKCHLFITLKRHEVKILVKLLVAIKRIQEKFQISRKAYLEMQHSTGVLKIYKKKKAKI